MHWPSGRCRCPDSYCGRVSHHAGLVYKHVRAQEAQQAFRRALSRLAQQYSAVQQCSRAGGRCSRGCSRSGSCCTDSAIDRRASCSGICAACRRMRWWRRLLARRGMRHGTYSWICWPSRWSVSLTYMQLGAKFGRITCVLHFKLTKKQTRVSMLIRVMRGQREKRRRQGSGEQ